MRRGGRWTAAIILIVIAAILVPVTIVARYTRGELLNTDRYVATVAPLAEQPAVQAALADRVTNEIVGAIDLPTLVENLTAQVGIKGAQALGTLVTGPITDWLTSFIHTHVLQFLASPQFMKLWQEINRTAHTIVTNVLTGKKNTAVSTSGDEVVLNIGPVVDAAKTQLVASGFALASKVPSVNATFTLFQSDQLPKIQKYVRLLNTAATWLPWLVLLLLIAAIAVSPNRRRAALIGLIAAIVVLVLTLIGVQLARHKYVTELTAAGRSVPAGTAVFDDVLHYLIVAIWTTLIAAFVVAVWLWLAGPSRPAVAVRRGIGHGLNAAARATQATRSGFFGFLDRARPWAYVILGLLAFALLLRSPTVVTVVWMLLVALILSAGFSIVHRLRTA